LGTKSGTIMRWNSNIGSDYTHRTEKLYGMLYGENKASSDIPFPANKLKSI
jgi:hypothetical protein